MAGTSKNSRAKERITEDQLEQKKRDCLALLLDESVRFVQTDNEINVLLKDLLGAVVAEVKRNPEAAFSGNSDINALVSALKAKAEGAGDVSGGDLAGAGVIGDIIDLVAGLVGVLKDEKEFFWKIIHLIWCGC